MHYRLYTGVYHCWFVTVQKIDIICNIVIIIHLFYFLECRIGGYHSNILRLMCGNLGCSILYCTARVLYLGHSCARVTGCFERCFLFTENILITLIIIFSKLYLILCNLLRNFIPVLYKVVSTQVRDNTFCFIVLKDAS